MKVKYILYAAIIFIAIGIIITATVKLQPEPLLVPICAAFAIWYCVFAVLTLLIGGALVIAGKNDEWVNWWLPW